MAVAIVSGPFSRAVADDVGCDALFERIYKSGALPVIRIDAAKQIVHVGFAGQKCSEPIDVWTARKQPPPKPKPAKTTPAPPPPKVKTSKPPAPLETHPMFKGPVKPAPSPPASPKPETEKAPADTGKTASGSACTKKLDEFWEWGDHMIEGVPYDLVGVFTIDLDGDGRTDNVGFKLTSTSMPDRVIRYFGAPGLVDARSISSLRLPEDGVIAHICFSQTAFQAPKPKPKSKKQPRKLFEPIDLAKEMKAREEQSEKYGSESDDSANTSIVRWIIIAGTVLFVIVGAGVVALVVLRRRRGPAGEEGDEEEDEDDEDEEEVDDEDRE